MPDVVRATEYIANPGKICIAYLAFRKRNAVRSANDPVRNLYALDKSSFTIGF